ncbi:MAG: Lrp/AsnC family transcriptional regulator [Candidatus Hodarchaeota archaeon]
MESKIFKISDLKETDKKILKSLLEDSNQSLSKIADKVGTTRQNISQRIKKLQEKDLINSYTIEINFQIIEELRVKAYILFREDPDTKVRKENEKKIVKIPQITNFSRLFGKYDGIIEILVKDNDEVTQILSELHKLEGIKETETFVVYNIIKTDIKSPILNLLK